MTKSNDEGTDSEEQIELRPLDFGDLVSSEWRSKYGPWIWIGIYRAMRLPEREIQRETKIVKTCDSIGFLFFGQPKLPQLETRFASADPPFIEARVGEPLVAPPGTYLLTIAPYIRGPTGDFLARCATDSWVGLLRAILGENLAYEKLTEYGLSLEDGSLNFFGPTVRNPRADDEPIVSEEDFNTVRDFHNALCELAVEKKNRVHLALRWYELSSRQRGVDAFLNQWITLEALGMENQNNVRPIVKSLASSYGLSIQKAKEKFGVGKIFGLRSEIMHKGLIPIIHQDLQRYLRAVFRDLLFAELGLPHRAETEAVALREGFDLSELLRYARDIPPNNANSDDSQERT